MAKYGPDKLADKNLVVSHEDDDKTNPHPDNLLLRTVSDHNSRTQRQRAAERKEKQWWDEYFATSTEFVPEEL